jgi:hypothetical protein
MILDPYIGSFWDELDKIALDKASGELTLDPNVASQTLKQVQRTPNRGPHPALNYEHQR